MAQSTSAAGQIWPHLAQGTPEPVKQRTPNIADAMFPGLSRAAKAKEASQSWAQAWAQKEQKESNARTVERLRQINERLERGG